MRDRPCQNYESPPCRDCQLECDACVGILESRLAEKEKALADAKHNDAKMNECLCLQAHETEKMMAERDEARRKLANLKWAEDFAVCQDCMEISPASKPCPMCAAFKERDEARNRVRELESQMVGHDSLTDQVDTLKEALKLEREAGG